MIAFLRLLLAFLTLGVDDGDPDPPDTSATDDGAAEGGEGDAAPAQGADEPTLDDLIETVEPTTQKQAPGADDDPAALRARAERAERALAERQYTPPPAPHGRDPIFEQEEAAISAAKARGEDTAWLEWKINTDRTNRANRAESQQALQAARDLADRTEFGRLEITKPKVYKMYAERVEKTIADMRAKGEVIPPRLVLLRVFMGDDLLTGKLKPKQARAATPAAAPANQVPRGRTPNVRSDVTGKGGGGSEHDKRRARLENVII